MPARGRGLVIPVVWASRHAAVLPRGTWDHGMLEAWLAESGRPLAHHELVGDRAAWPEAEGVVVVVSGRNHASADDVAWLRGRLARYERVWLVVTGDEAGEFPAARVRHSGLTTWHMGAPADARRVAQPLGSGWPGHYPGLLPAEPPAKRLDLFLAGQDTHDRRHRAFDALEALPGGRIESVRTESFTAGLPPADYAARMAEARVVPCPSGPESPDSFRAYEALEAGAIPVLDARTPHGPEPAYWTWTFGLHPCPEITDWAELGPIADGLLDEWPASANRVQAWWEGWKRAMRWRVVDELDRVAGGPLPMPAEGQITVIVTSSPAPIHPATEHLATTIASIRAQLPEAEILVGFDGVRPEDAHRADDYAEYVRRAIWRCAREWSRVTPVVAPAWEHQANLTRRLLALVHTPIVLFAEHDTPLTGRPTDWPGLVAALRSGEAQVMRLHHEAEVHPDHEHLMIDRVPRAVGGVPALRTVQWSQRPHLARTRWYRELLDRHFAPSSRTMIEDVLHGIVEAAWHDAGTEGWEDWRVWLYAPEGSMQRSVHLDSRGDDPKHPMTFAYPGAPPPGAPQPGTR